MNDRESAAPSAPQTPSSGRCPVCGAYVGPTTRCSVCGAELVLRTPIRVFRWAALLLGTLGLFMLLLMARSREIPRVQVSDLTPTMNFALVRVSGTAVGDPRIYRREERVEGVRFHVRDSSGEIQVRAQGAIAQELVQQDLLPRSGDEVEVDGVLSVGPDGDTTFLRVLAPSKVRVTRSQLPITPIGQIRSEDEGRTFRVRGRIVSVRAPAPGGRAPWTIDVQDESGRSTLVWFSDVHENLAEADRLKPGTWVEARVTASLHRGRLQLQLTRAGDLQWMDDPGAGTSAPQTESSPPAESPTAVSVVPGEPRGREPAEGDREVSSAAQYVALSSLKPDLAGLRVRIRGRVEAVREPRPGTRSPWTLTLSDGEARATVVYWPEVADRLHADGAPEPGREVEVTGLVGLYRGRVQVRVEDPAAIRWLGEGRGTADGEGP